MSVTLKALRGTLNADGSIRLSEPCDIRGPVPVLVTVAVEETESADEGTVSDEWSAEIARRAREIEDGEVDLIDEKTFLDRLKSA